ncbi:MAG: metallophosphoesterase [Firmicutes bacterium]|nr:metallophosphoesterase [Bacillota bacterium]
MEPARIRRLLEEDPESFGITRSRADQTIRAVRKLPQATLSAGARRGKQVVRTSGRLVRTSRNAVRKRRGGADTGAKRRKFRILAVADDESRCYYEDYRQGVLDGFDLILACGDLHRTYLEFLTTMAKCPVLYIRGNHDDPLIEEPPGGCICIEDQVYVHEGLRIAGLGGSYQYRDGRNMFTEAQMRKRARRLMPKIRKQGGLDILMTHAPARGINDFDSLSHRGFETFGDLLDRYHPQVFVHGHIHKNYGVRIPQRTELGRTTVINAYEHCIFEIEI